MKKSILLTIIILLAAVSGFSQTKKFFLVGKEINILEPIQKNEEGVLKNINSGMIK